MNAAPESHLILPESATITLHDNSGSPLHVANIIFEVHLFARQKNDFYLAPFSSDASGRVSITRSELEWGIAATYDSGIMDYAGVENCFPLVELRLLSGHQIDQRIAARKTWRSLLKGEAERWSSIDDLLRVYRHARNKDFVIYEGYSRIRDQWDGHQTDYNYDYSLGPR